MLFSAVGDQLLTRSTIVHFLALFLKLECWLKSPQRYRLFWQPQKGYRRRGGRSRRLEERKENDTSKSRDLAAELFHAVEDNDTVKLQELIQIGADVNEYYQSFGNITSGKSILHVSSEKGRLECSRILVDHGADICITDKWQMTPLMYCIIAQYPDVASFLLSREPSTVDAQGKYGKSAMHCAVETGNTEMIAVLIDYGADVNIRNDFGMTPLLLLCSLTDINRHAVDMFDMLVQAGADINAADYRSCQCALQFAVRRKNCAVSERLLRLGADPDSTDRSHRTPLTNLINENLQRGSDVTDDLISISSELIKYGAKLNRTDHINSNPLTIATSFNSVPLIKLLLKFGAKPNIVVGKQTTALKEAITKNHVTAVIAFVNGGLLSEQGDETQDRFDPMLLAIEYGRWEIVTVLSLAGFNLSKYSFFTDPDTIMSLPLLDNVHLLLYLKEISSTPRRLFHCAVLTIWRMLGNNIGDKIFFLPIPTVLKENITPEVFLLSDQKP